jgi:hypothetical protein
LVDDARDFKVPKPEKAEVLAAFAAHKNEVTAGYVAAAKRADFAEGFFRFSEMMDP